MARKITARQVAEAAGVSPATVDRVLNGRGGVAVEKEKRVLEWAHKLGIDRDLRHRPIRMLRIGVVMPPPSDPFFDSLRLAFARANNLFRAANVQSVVSYADPLPPGAAAKVMRDVAARNDALIVVALDYPETKAALAAIARSKPVVTIVTDMPSIPRLAYVGLDNTAAARVAGDLMCRLIGPAGGKIVLVTGNRRMIALQEREEGFRQILAERHPACELVSVIDATGREAQAGVLVADELATHGSLGGVYVTSLGNRAIAAALTARGLAREIVFITHELTSHRRDLLKGGVIDAIIDQNPELEALTAIETLAHEFGRLEAAPTRAKTPFTLFFRENC